MKYKLQLIEIHLQHIVVLLTIMYTLNVKQINIVRVDLPFIITGSED